MEKPSVPLRDFSVFLCVIYSFTESHRSISQRFTEKNTLNCLILDLMAIIRYFPNPIVFQAVPHSAPRTRNCLNYDLNDYMKTMIFSF